MVKIADLNELDSMYTSQETKGIYPDDSKEQVAAVFNGGYYFPETSEVGTPYVGEVQFNPVSSSAGYVNQLHPFKKQSNNVFWLGLQEINTTLQDSPIAPNPFVAQEFYGSSVTEFKYKGTHSTFAYLKGNLNISVRLYESTAKELQESGRAPPKLPTLWIELVSPTNPPAERNTRKGIGMAVPTVQTEITRTTNTRDNITVDYIKANLAKFTKKDLLGIANSRILADSFDETLEYQDGSRTTDWCDVRSNYIFTTTDGTSSINRIQLKTDKGDIYYGKNMGADGESAHEKLYTLPNDVVAYRICFASSADTSKYLSVYEIDKDTTNRGLWANYSITIDSMVAFAPDTQYGFVLRFYDTNSDMNISEDSFFISSGSISSLINCRDEIQKWKDIMVEEHA